MKKNDDCFQKKYKLAIIKDVNVLFVLSACVNGSAPGVEILFSVNHEKHIKVIMDTTCVYQFFVTQLSKMSLVSDLFTFNASLNDVTPLFPIQFPGYGGGSGKNETDRIPLFTCISDQVLQVSYLSLIIHSMMLLQYIQCHCLLLGMNGYLSQVSIL